jgi:hypothetical protein
MTSLPIERYAKQAFEREASGIYTPVASKRIAADLDDLQRLYRLTWERRQRAIMEDGCPIGMPEGTFAGVLNYPAAQTVTTTSLNGTVNLWLNMIYTQIPINSVMAPQIYRIVLAAKITTSTSPANIGFNPLINNAGTWTTGGTAVAGGSTLGASGNIALTASITNAFYIIKGDLTIRNPGTSSVVVGMFEYKSTQGTAGGLAGPAAIGTGHNLLFGGTAVTVDTQTTGQSLQFGAVHTVATITHNIEQPHFMDWN